MRLSVLALFSLALAMGCRSSLLELSDGASTDLARSPDLRSSSDQAGCRDDKFRFVGCRNDGSVEFCAPPSLTSTLMAMVPSLTCRDSAGRANCNAPGLLLCLYPTQPPRECQSFHGELTAIATQELCAIAAHDEITEIIPTFFE